MSSFGGNFDGAAMYTLPSFPCRVASRELSCIRLTGICLMPCDSAAARAPKREGYR